MRFKVNPEKVVKILKSKSGLEEKIAFNSFLRDYSRTKLVITNKGHREFEVALGPYGGRWHGCVGITIFRRTRTGMVRPQGDARSRVGIQLRFKRRK